MNLIETQREKTKEMKGKSTENEDTIKKLKERIQTLNEAIKNCNTNIGNNIKEYAKTRRILEDATRQVDTLQNSCIRLDGEIRNKNSELELYLHRAIAKSNNLQNEIEQLRGNLDDQNKKGKDLNEEIDSIESEMAKEKENGNLLKNKSKSVELKNTRLKSECEHLEFTNMQLLEQLNTSLYGKPGRNFKVISNTTAKVKPSEILTQRAPELKEKNEAKLLIGMKKNVSGLNTKSAVKTHSRNTKELSSFMSYYATSTTHKISQYVPKMLIPNKQIAEKEYINTDKADI